MDPVREAAIMARINADEANIAARKAAARDTRHHLEAAARKAKHIEEHAHYLPDCRADFAAMKAYIAAAEARFTQIQTTLEPNKPLDS